MSTGDFNYADVDEDTASKLEYFAASGKSLIRKSQVQFIADMGQLLSDARKVLANHGSGVFIKWATAEFDVTAKTVYRYVNAWEKCLCHDVTNFAHWSATAIYMLADDAIPKPVQKKLQKMPRTDLVRASDVKRLIDSSKPKSKPAPAAPVQDEPEQTDDSVPFDIPASEQAPVTTPPVADSVSDAKPDHAAEQAARNRKLAQAYIDKAIRAVCDLHEFSPNRGERDRIVKALQHIGGQLW